MITIVIIIIIIIVIIMITIIIVPARRQAGAGDDPVVRTCAELFAQASPPMVLGPRVQVTRGDLREVSVVPLEGPGPSLTWQESGRRPVGRGGNMALASLRQSLRKQLPDGKR